MFTKKNKKYFEGCLVGGAIGDALGAPVEFLSYKEIKEKFGENGVRNLIYNKYQSAKITDDTQMTMFTAEGLLRARGVYSSEAVVFRAYLRWLFTQGEITQNIDITYSPQRDDDGWLMKLKDLYAVRAPGATCLSSLNNGVMGTIKNHINNNKGCGCVIRVAPVGLYITKSRVFELSSKIAAITHGHSSGYLSAGTFAMIIHNIIYGKSILESVENSIKILKTQKNHKECLDIIEYAIELYRASELYSESIEKIGKGWVAEEALAISIYCSLVAGDDFKKGVTIAVNHSGDSDSTGSLTGNILGAYLGIDAIPKDWIKNIELSKEIIELADDLFIGYREGNEWYNKYPGY